MKNTYNYFILCAIIVAAFQVHAAETQYTWKGTVDSDFANSANWDAGNGPAPFGGSYTNGRINVYNGSNQPLYYTAAQGYTIYQNTGRAIFIGNGSTAGSMYLTGGTFESQSTDASGLSNNSDGNLVVDGGVYRHIIGNKTFFVKFGGLGTGMLTVSNGLFEAGDIRFGNAGYTGSGVLNLDGGTTRVSKIYSGMTGSSVINFNGGILGARATEAAFLQGLGAANVLAGGSVIDTLGNSIGIDQNLLDGGGGGGLIKRGEGTLTLGGTNTFTGNIIVEAGTLRASNKSALGTTAGSTTVIKGASLELSGNITITNESLIIAGKTSNNFGALSGFSGDCTWAGNVLLSENNTRITASTEATLRISGVIDDGPENYNIEFRGYGTGIMVVSGQNTYGGKTSLVLATLRLDGGNNRLPIGTQLVIGNSANYDYATFDLNGFDQEVAMLDDLGDITNSVIDSAGGGTLTVNDSGNRTFAGNFVGPLTLVKTNSNVMTLDGDMQATSVAVSQGTLQGSATWHCLFNDADTPNQMTVTDGTLDISAMTFDFDENAPIKSGSYVIVDYSAGGTLTANAEPPYFAATVDMPERGTLRHNTAKKQILFTYGMEGTLILLN